MKLKIFLIFVLIALVPLPAQKLPFIFLGVKTDFQPDLSMRLEKMISQNLENVKKLDQLTSNEIGDLQIDGIISDRIPNEIQAKTITQTLGPAIISSVYLGKIYSKAKNKFWPPFSREIELFGKIELVVLNGQSGELLYSGDIPVDAKITKLFSKTQTKEPYKFLPAIDREKLVKSLLIKFSDQVSERIQQVIAGFEFIKQ